MKSIFKFAILSLLCCFTEQIKSQTLPIGSVIENYYRQQQVLGNVDSSLSLSLRPVNIDLVKLVNNKDGENFESFIASKPFSIFKHGAIRILPITWQQQFNSTTPYGWNDGVMIPARGYQTVVTAGIFVRSGILSIQLKPEYLYASNTEFDGFAKGHGDNDLGNYYFSYNNIDAPERFGKGVYNKLYWGQSSIRLSVGSVSLGLSNENIWWGPGIRNSIILSNNAPGFKHITFNTVKPINTVIGSFEGQIIGGRLDGSNLSPLEKNVDDAGRDLYEPKSGDWRYLSALNIIYHPKWVPGLFLGFTRSFMTYSSSLNSASDYFPLLVPFQKGKVNAGLGETTDRDQRTSFYARWLFVKAKAELYFEYGLNDNSYNIRDFLGSPEHSRAYIFGLTKMLHLNTGNEFIKINGEVTQLSQTVDYLTRYAGSFYYHNPIRHGYTQQGQVIGAGIGSGGNLQSMNVSWVKGLKQLGLGMERYEHNMDLATLAGFVSLNGLSRNWVDFALAANGTWNYKNLLFNAKLQGIKSLNYQWVLKDYEPGKYYIPHNDLFNFHGELGVTYRF